MEKFNSRRTDFDAFWEYPFSPLYGWVVDKFGVSWQVSFQEKNKQLYQPLCLLMKNMAKQPKLYQNGWRFSVQAK